MELAPLAQSVADTLEPVALARGISLTRDCREAIAIAGDRGWLEQLLVNLVDNAIKFTPPGGWVRVSVAANGPRATLVVSDAGSGIPPEELPRIFDRFYRGDPARSPNQDGAGLGVSLVKWIADQHAATIDVVSRTGHGSTFTVSFPQENQRELRNSGAEELGNG